jgi:hypothetical protein
MTDEPKPTYEELEAELAIAKEANTRLRKTSDDNYTNGREWKAQAEALTKQLDNAVANMTSAMSEAAELRGYIRRVNELDPKRVRQQQIEHTGPSQRELDRMMRRGY